MTLDEFIALRKSLGMTQTQFGKAIGLSLRSMSEIEGGTTTLRVLHTLAAERVALAYAAHVGKPMLAPAAVRRDAMKLVRDFEGT